MCCSPLSHQSVVACHCQLLNVARSSKARCLQLADTPESEKKPICPRIYARKVWFNPPLPTKARNEKKTCKIDPLPGGGAAPIHGQKTVDIWTTLSESPARCLLVAFFKFWVLCTVTSRPSFRVLRYPLIPDEPPFPKPPFCLALPLLDFAQPMLGFVFDDARPCLTIARLCSWSLA